MKRPHKTFTYLDDAEKARLERLARKLDRSAASVLREALRVLAEREKVE